MQLFAFVIMPHHIHFIAASGNAGVQRRDTANEADAAPELHPLIRDFKRFTPRTIHDRLKQGGRTTILHWLEAATQQARQKRDELGLWQPGFHPQAIYSRSVFEQKLNYLHENPVRKGLVRQPEDWWYSSAAFYTGRKDVCMEMDWLEI